MSEEFKNIVASSPELQARWHAMTDRLAAKVREEFGVEVSKEELADLTSVRLAVLSGDETLLATFSKEVERHPGVAAAKKERELARVLADQKDPAHGGAREAFDKLSPQEKIKRARQIEAAKPPAEKRPELSVEERAQAVADVTQLRGGMKIAEARRRGVA